MTPGAYRRRGTGVTIHYTAVPTSLGLLLVAVTERGICGVSLGDDEPTLVTALQHEYPGAALERATDARDRLIDAVIAHVEGRASGETLPLDVRAPAFQWQGWRALQRIPEGATRSYQAIADELGRPAAARAVARACATNRVAVLIPCHRVVRGDGGLGGYRWGIARKAALLAREAGERTAELLAWSPRSVYIRDTTRHEAKHMTEVFSQATDPALAKAQLKQSIQDIANAARDAAQAQRDAALARRDARTPGGFQGEFPPQRPNTFPIQPNANSYIRPKAVAISIAFFVICAGVGIGWPPSRRFARRIERRTAEPAQVSAQITEQLQRIEQAVDTMAIEIERISHAQRFMAKLQNQDAAERALPR